MSQKQIFRTLFAALNETDLFRVVDHYLQLISGRLQKTTKEISYKCFECHCKIKNKAAVGFGRNETQTLINAVRNLIEVILDDDKTFVVMKEAVTNAQIKQDILNKNYNSRKSELQTKDQNRENIKPKEQTEGGSKSSLIQTSSTLKIKPPNSTAKPRAHESYLSQSVNCDNSISQLQRAYQQIKDLEARIKDATTENEELKGLLEKQQNVEASNLDALEYKIHAKVRSISVEPGMDYKFTSVRPSSYLTESTHTNVSTLQDTKKDNFRVPRLKLEMLPNYHGKSNKSLNQSLLEAYGKSKK